MSVLAQFVGRGDRIIVEMLHVHASLLDKGVRKATLGGVIRPLPPGRAGCVRLWLVPPASNDAGIRGERMQRVSEQLPHRRGEQVEPDRVLEVRHHPHRAGKELAREVVYQEGRDSRLVGRTDLGRPPLSCQLGRVTHLIRNLRRSLPSTSS
jgi:hypothetical protein